jgi:hypothetical protein
MQSDISESIRDLQSLLRDRYEGTSNIVNEVIDQVKPGNREAMVEVSNHQWQAVSSTCAMLIEVFYTSELSEALAAEVEELERFGVTTIRTWCEHDASEACSNVNRSAYFPNVVRGKEDEWPLLHRSVVLTRYGADQLLDGGFPEVKTGFISNLYDTVSETRSNIESIPAQDYITVTTPTGNKVRLEKPARGMKAVDSSSATMGVSYSEPWSIRVNEARRYTPYSVTQMCHALASIVSKLGTASESADERARRFIDYGLYNVFVSLSYLGCEWLARTGTAMSSRKESFSLRKLTEAWINGDTIRQPHWLARWANPKAWGREKAYDYITNDELDMPAPSALGLAAWSKDSLQPIRVSEDDDPTTLREVIVDETRMPFIERSDGGFPYQQAALTTVGPLRLWLGFSMCIETMNSMHMPKGSFDVYYRHLFRYYGTEPGSLGKKAAKVAVRMARLLSSDMYIHLPNSEEIPGDVRDVLGCEVEKEATLFTDRLALRLLCENLDNVAYPMDGTRRATIVALKDAIAEGISKLNDHLGPGLMAVYKAFSGENMHDHIVSNFNKGLLDAITHLSAAGSSEGYVRSCIADLPVSGYKSSTFRRVVENIDSSAPVREVDSYESEIISAMTNFTSPTMTDLYKYMRKLSKATSGGGDRVKFKFDQGEVVDGSSNNIRDGVSSNKKDILYLTAGFIMGEGGSYLRMRSSPEEPWSLGKRSVPARMLRYVYIVPSSQQILLYPFYQEMLRYMADPSKGYALVGKEGLPIKDSLKEINASIRMAKERPTPGDVCLMCVAHDASTLDQHIGPAHRRVIVDTLRANAQIGSEVLITDENGNDYTYLDLLINVFQSWDKSFYSTPVPSAPAQLIQTDTQPSGAQTTAVDNSVVTMGMVHMMERICGVEFTGTQVWGDDMYALLSTNEHDSIDRIRMQEKAALSAGQILDTVGGSTSGRVVHFLQKLYVGGQEVRRRMPFDFENPVGKTLLPGKFGEIVDKWRDSCARGGNKKALNAMVLMTVALGCRTSQYGKQATTSFLSMAAPGGTLNRLLVGYHSPNSQLYLQLNSNLLFGSPGPFEIEAVAKTDKPMSVGKRALSSAFVQSGSDRLPGYVGTQLGGVLEYREVDNLISAATGKLMEETRFISRDERTESMSRVLSELSDAARDTVYNFSIRRGAEIAIGSQIVDKHLQPKFKEKAMVEAGQISDGRRNQMAERVMTNSTIHDGFRVGADIYRFSMSSPSRDPSVKCYCIQLPHTSHGTFDLIEYSSSDPKGRVMRSFGQKWHPYFYMPTPSRMLLSLLGINTESNQFSPRSPLKAFSPGHFRSDLTAEEVIDHVKKLPTPDDKLTYLRMVGFNDDEVGRLANKLPNLRLFEDLSEASEFSSAPDIIKSAGFTIASEILSYTSMSVAARLTNQSDNGASSLLYSHFISLLSDEINVACTLLKASSEQNVYVRIPQITVEQST